MPRIRKLNLSLIDQLGEPWKRRKDVDELSTLSGDDIQESNSRDMSLYVVTRKLYE